MKSKYKIYYTGSEEQAEYIREYSLLNQDNSPLIGLSDKQLKGKGGLKQNLLKIFSLDRPDVIITDNNDNPLLAIELLEQKPVGYNHIQRFPRCVSCALNKVPFAYILPQERYLWAPNAKRDVNRKYGFKEGNFILRREYKIFHALDMAMRIHKIPLLAFKWPIDESLKYISEGLVYNKDKKFVGKQLPPAPNQDSKQYSDIKDLFDFINLVVLNNKDINSLMKKPLVKKIYNRMKGFPYEKQHISLRQDIPEGIDIARRIPSSKFKDFLITNTSLYSKNPKLFEEFLKSNIFNKILSRKEILIIDPPGNKHDYSAPPDPFARNRGYGDPYCGVTTAFDYYFCRNGEKPTQRGSSLVFFARHPNGDNFFYNIINTCLKDNKFPAINKFENIKNIEEIIEITKNVLKFDKYRLRKELKVFFTICDIILTKEMIYFGEPLLQNTFLSNTTVFPKK